MRREKREERREKREERREKREERERERERQTERERERTRERERERTILNLIRSPPTETWRRGHNDHRTMRAGATPTGSLCFQFHTEFRP